MLYRLYRLSRLAAIAALTGSTLTVGAAAGVGLGTADFGSGDAAVSACAAPGEPSLSYAADSAGRITAVVVTGLPSACDGGRLSATLVDSAGAALAAGGPVAVSAAPAVITVPVSPAVASTGVARSDLVVVGA